MKGLIRFFFALILPFVSQAQHLELIPGAVVKGKPYITAVENGVSGSYFFSSQIDHVNSTPASSLTKTDHTGRIVTSFASIETNSHILSIEELPDGKILIAGWFTEINGIKVGSVVRLNADGSIDNTFTRWADIPSSGYVSRFVRQSDGKIVVVGSFSDYLGSDYDKIVRLNHDGTVDETFALNVTDLPFVPFIEVDEKDNLAITSGRKLYKLTPDGQIHPDFPPIDGGETVNFSDFKFFKDGEILVAGRFNSFAGVQVDNIARITANGTVDPFFNPGKFINYIWDMEVTGDGTIIVATQDGIKIFDNTGNEILKQGLAAYSIERMFLDKAQNLLVYGNFDRINGVEKHYVARLTKEFAFDDSFSTFFSYTTGIQKIAAQGDGKILLGGHFAGINDAYSNLLRLNLDGSVDDSFDPKISLPAVMSLLVLDNRKLLVSSGYSIRRLTSTGDVDDAFHQGTFAPSIYLSSLETHRDKIYVSGSFDSFDGFHSPAIVRLNMDGTIDRTFQSNLPSSTYISEFEFQSGDRIVATGVIPFSTGQKRLIRLQDNGLLDDTFFPSNHVYNGIREIKVDSKDNIYLAGDFTDLNGQAIAGLAKLTPDGLLDDGFQYPFSSLVQFNAMEIIGDNEIVLGSSSPRIGLLVIDSTGRFIQTPYTSDTIISALTSLFFDGKTLLVGGRILAADLQTVSGIGYVNFVKVVGRIDDLQASRLNSHAIQLTWTNNVSGADAIVVERSMNDALSFTEIQSLPPTATAFEDSDASEENTYYYRLRGANSGSLSNYSNESHVDKLVVAITENRTSWTYVYPNPTTGLLYVDGPYDSPIRATVLNCLGTVVATPEVANGTIDVSQLAPATYILKLQDADGNRRLRFVKK